LSKEKHFPSATHSQKFRSDSALTWYWLLRPVRTRHFVWSVDDQLTLIRTSQPIWIKAVTFSSFARKCCPWSPERPQKMIVPCCVQQFCFAQAVVVGQPFCRLATWAYQEHKQPMSFERTPPLPSHLAVVSQHLYRFTRHPNLLPIIVSRQGALVPQKYRTRPCQFVRQGLMATTFLGFGALR